jgi:hypothetical protein
MKVMNSIEKGEPPAGNPREGGEESFGLPAVERRLFL